MAHSNEIAITNIRRLLSRMSETLAVASPHVEEEMTPEVRDRLANAYARLSAASAEIDALGAIARELRSVK